MLRVDAATFNGLVPYLQATLAGYAPGSCAVAIEYRIEGAAARVRLADDWRVKATDNLVDELQARLGDGTVRIEY